MNKKKIVLKVKHALVILNYCNPEVLKTGFYQELKKLNAIHGSLFDDLEKYKEFRERKETFTLTKEEIGFTFDALKYVIECIIIPAVSAIDGAKEGSWQFHDGWPEDSDPYVNVWPLEEFIGHERDNAPGLLKDALDALYYFTHQVHPKPENINYKTF